MLNNDDHYTLKMTDSSRPGSILTLILSDEHIQDIFGKEAYENLRKVCQIRNVSNAKDRIGIVADLRSCEQTEEVVERLNYCESFEKTEALFQPYITTIEDTYNYIKENDQLPRLSFDLFASIANICDSAGMDVKNNRPEDGRIFPGMKDISEMDDLFAKIFFILREIFSASIKEADRKFERFLDTVAWEINRLSIMKLEEIYEKICEAISVLSEKFEEDEYLFTAPFLCWRALKVKEMVKISIKEGNNA